METRNDHTSQHIHSVFDGSPLPSDPFTAFDEGKMRTIAHQKTRSKVAQDQRKVGQAECKIGFQIEDAAK